MPSVYAHYRFGREILELLPDDISSILIEHRELFDIGLQGPDILFFYKPVFKNYVNQLGKRIHEWKGRRFFIPAVRQIRCLKNKDASIAYICGVACHYALDAICHPYIHQCEMEMHLNHSAIEGAFERALIVEDRLPLNTLITHSIKKRKQNAYIISHFYGKTTCSQIYKALRFMVLCNDGLRLKDNLIKKTIFLFLRLIGKYHSISGMVITELANPQYAETDQCLRELFEDSKEFAVSILNEIVKSIKTGTPLSSNFDATFMG